MYKKDFGMGNFILVVDIIDLTRHMDKKNI